MPKKLTTEEFINKAKKVHGDKYDYSKVNYINAKTKVEIICNKCGNVFWKIPYDHLIGQGCKLCSRLKMADTLKKTKEEFIFEAKQIHGNLYDYRKINYINNRNKIEIVCITCGNIFYQTPSNHLAGQGCPYCSNRHKSTTEEFVKKAKKVHGDNYNYSKVNYINNRTKVEIICSIHGSFIQTPTNHLTGNGCPYCADNIKKTTEEFVQQAKKIHGNKYDYSKINYINAHNKVELICNTCGNIFWQEARSHLTGDGCPYCAYASRVNNKPAHLYYVSINNGEYYKIGVTTQSIQYRMHKKNLNYKVLLWEEFKNPVDAIYKEQKILKEYGEFRYSGKEKVLGNIGGDTELFIKDVLVLDEENQ